MFNAPEEFPEALVKMNNPGLLGQEALSCYVSYEPDNMYFNKLEGAFNMGSIIHCFHKSAARILISASARSGHFVLG